MNNDNQHLGMHAGAKPELFRFAEELREQMTEPEQELWDDRNEVEGTER